MSSQARLAIVRCDRTSDLFQEKRSHFLLQRETSAIAFPKLRDRYPSL
ncbi:MULTISPECIES: hypothetical protein [Spirulina sp. CCY15215]|nr:hypothetical protein [Spirulina major]